MPKEQLHSPVGSAPGRKRPRGESGIAPGEGRRGPGFTRISGDKVKVGRRPSGPVGFVFNVLGERLINLVARCVRRRRRHLARGGGRGGRKKKFFRRRRVDSAATSVGELTGK